MKSKPNWLSLGMALPRLCLRNAVPEILDAAKYLDEAVSAYIANQRQSAEERIALANSPAISLAIGEWAESLRGKYNIYNRPILEVSPKLDKAQRLKPRMPSAADKHRLLLRDAYRCRFCGIPVVREEVRHRLISLFPSVIPWGPPNAKNHAALYAMDVQYDHLLPHSRGGSSDLDNMVITCNPCNYGRGEHTIEEMGLVDPKMREPVQSTWDGLERLLGHSEQ